MARATTEEWGRYYQGARERRRKTGGDPYQRYAQRKEAQERRWLVASGLVLAAIVVAFCSVLVR